MTTYNGLKEGSVIQS